MAKNYKTLIIEFREALDKWWDIPYSWIGRHNIVNIPVLSKYIYWLNAIPIKIPGGFCRYIYSKIYGKTTELEELKQFWERKINWEESVYPISRLTIAKGVKTLWCVWRDRHKDQWNRKENLEIDPHKYAQLIFDKGAKEFNEGRITFSIEGAGETMHL